MHDLLHIVFTRTSFWTLLQNIDAVPLIAISSANSSRQNSYFHWSRSIILIHFFSNHFYHNVHVDIQQAWRNSSAFPQTNVHTENKLLTFLDTLPQEVRCSYRLFNRHEKYIWCWSRCLNKVSKACELCFWEGLCSPRCIMMGKLSVFF